MQSNFDVQPLSKHLLPEFQRTFDHKLLEEKRKKILEPIAFSTLKIESITPFYLDVSLWKLIFQLAISHYLYKLLRLSAQIDNRH